MSVLDRLFGTRRQRTLLVLARLVLWLPGFLTIPPSGAAGHHEPSLMFLAGTDTTC